MHRRAAAQKAGVVVTAAVVACLVINTFLLNSWSVDYNISYDPSEISRRLDGEGQQRTIRDRIIDSLREHRGVQPGDPDFQRLFLARLDDWQKQSEIPTARRIALRTLASRRQIWMRQIKEVENKLLEEAQQRKLNTNEEVLNNVEPLSVCGRPTNVGTRADLAFLEHSAGADHSCPSANSNKLLLLQNHKTYGQTGNNLIEILHASQYAHDNNVTLGIMNDSWPLRVLLPMFMAVKDKAEWRHQFEQALCVKLFDDNSQLTEWDIVQWDDLYKLGEGRGSLGKDVDYLTSKKMFVYVSQAPLIQYISHQTKVLQALYRNYNTGTGTTSRPWESVRNMCSGIDGVFGDDRDAVYSVIHLRSLEGQSGLKLMERMSKSSGCHPTAALEMEPEYIKSILRPLGMLQFPIVLITDGQNFNALRRLVNDPDIGPKLRLVDESSSWIGGDITLAVMSNVFIGNPASTFSGFITKSRLALGFGHSYLFRAQNENGEWVDTCGDTCVFDSRIMGSMS